MLKNKIIKETNLLDLIKHICQRPQMYTGSWEFRIVAAFIEGFAYANENIDDLREFSFWLGTKFKLPRNVVWICNFEKLYSNNEDAFKELPKLYEEYKNANMEESPDFNLIFR